MTKAFRKGVSVADIHGLLLLHYLKHGSVIRPVLTEYRHQGTAGLASLFAFMFDPPVRDLRLVTHQHKTE